jgi:peroxiredoxin
MTSLSQELEAYRAGWRQRVPADRQAAMERHIAHLEASGFGTSAKQVGDLAPDVRLPDATGKTVSLASLVQKGPVVIAFYRGGWCPFCNMQLKAYEAVLPRIKAAGANIVAISTEKPDDTVTTAEKNALTFPVLSDVGQKAGKAFGVVYAFTEELRSVYEGFRATGRCRSRRPT